MSRRFSAIATGAAHATGHWSAFAAAVAVVAVWSVVGIFVGYGNTLFQLAINTGTTIVTFLMVFLLQHAQERDTRAIQAKLDELIRAIDDADNAKIGLEKEGG